MSTTLLISSFAPFPTFALTVPSNTQLSALPELLPDCLPSLECANLVLSRHTGVLSLDSTPLSSLCDDQFAKGSSSSSSSSSRLVSLRLAPRLCGGKGGFGSQLRAAGGRMSSQKTSNNDSCRDLNGRKLSTIKEAKALAAYLEGEPERKKARQEERRAKLERLERKLGINWNNGKAEGSSASAKRRFDDTEFLEQSRDIVDNVKSAVIAGMLKKKKRKISPSPQEAQASSATEHDSTLSREVEAKTTEATEEVSQGTPSEAEVPKEATNAPETPVAPTSLAAIGA